MKTPALIFFASLCFAQISSGQSKLNFDSLIVSNALTFKGTGNFSGKGWSQLLQRAGQTNYVLIGEDHFISEVPLFTQALTTQLAVDNYICEIDQWMLTIFKNKITTLPPAQLEKWISDNYNGFSFFQKKNEFELLQQLIKKNVHLIGIEQIGLMSTTIIFQHLIETGSAKNRRWYEVMRDSSDVSNNRFFSDTNKPYFMATSFFMEAMNKLDKAAMTKDEADLTQALIRSADIYRTGSHRDRIKLMQSNLMNSYASMKGKKDVFKFGANHAMKGESYLPVYDIGTTAHVLAQSENQDSYHILVLPKTGSQAGFIKGTNTIDLNDDLYRSLKPFFDKASDTEWTFIDLEKIRAAVRKHEYQTGSAYLEKTVKGYDALVVIPVATAAAAVR